MRMVSKSWVNLLVVADGVPSWSQHQKCRRRREFLVSGISCFLTGAMRSWSWHMKCKRRREFLLSGISSIWCCNILVMAPGTSRGGSGFSATVYSSIWCHDNPGHGTRNCKRRREFLVSGISCFLTGAMRSWSWHQKLQEEGFYYQYEL